VTVRLPASDVAHPWQLEWDSTWESPQDPVPVVEDVPVGAHSVQVLTTHFS
jgi:hypothetical protein